jgi:hypothetical protein
VKLPTNFNFRGVASQTTRLVAGNFTCIVELSLSGLYRKFLANGNGRDFREFLEEAIKQFVLIQIYKRLTSKNYENLDLEEGLSHDTRGLLSKTRAIRSNWASVNVAHFSLTEYKTSEWIKILNTRSRDEDDKKFILDFQ